MIIVAGVALMAALFGALLWWSWAVAKKRREAMAAWAAERGWTWVAEDDRWRNQWNGSPFNQGHSRHARNVLTGSYDQRPCVAFDYEYSETSTSSDGKSSTSTYHFSVVAIRSAAPLVDLSVAPEGFVTRFLGNLTNSDIDFEWEEFNRAFHVTSAGRKFANDVIHQQMMEYLMQHPKVAWSFRDGWLLVITSRPHELTEIDTKLAFADGVLDRIPRFVWEAYGTVDPGAPGPSTTPTSQEHP